MRHTRTLVSGLVMMLLVVPSARAQSQPVIEGTISGIELCPQFVCGAAIFAGEFQGRVGFLPHRRGIFWVAAQHEPLPEPGGTALITGGEWSLKTLLRSFRGVIGLGTITNNGDETFTVEAILGLTRGGSGTLYFVGILDHNPLFESPPRPPTLKGELLQTPPE